MKGTRDPAESELRVIVEKARRRTDGGSTLDFALECVRLGFRKGTAAVRDAIKDGIRPVDVRDLASEAAPTSLAPEATLTDAQIAAALERGAWNRDAAEAASRGQRPSYPAPAAKCNACGGDLLLKVRSDGTPIPGTTRRCGQCFKADEQAPAVALVRRGT